MGDNNSTATTTNTTTALRQVWQEERVVLEGRQVLHAW
jgi:hypothetical protein